MTPIAPQYDEVVLICLDDIKQNFDTTYLLQKCMRNIRNHGR